MTIAVSNLVANPAKTAERPQVRIVIVGHVDHGKSTLVGRLLHETGSLPDGKLEMLKAVSARRGMPFEWSFLLDALQTERDQGITIDTTQIRFRTPSRDIVLIDAPGHAEFLRNMITGASQADAAVLIIDAAEGVRDQTRRHGYLLHLLGIRQVAIVINKMDRVDFSQSRFDEISREITAHLTGLGVTPTAIIPISAREGDGVAERTPSIAWYAGPTVVEALDALTPARRLDELALRLPVQAIYKFDDRRIVAGRIESGSLIAGDEIVIMPSGKIARIRTVESWPTTPVATRQGAGHSVGITLDRELFLERGDIISHTATAPRDTRRLHARVFWLHDQPLTAGASILVRLGTKETRATVVAIENAVDPGELSSVGTQSIARNHVGEIDISLAQPVAADPYSENARTGRLVIEVNGRIAGGGLVLSVDAGQRAVPVDIVPVESALRPDERSARYGHGGAVVWFTGLPGAGKSTLARALERKLFSRGGSPILLDGDTLRAGLNGDLGFSPKDRAENVRRLAEIAAHLARNGHIAIVAAVSPSAEDRAQARRIADDLFREVYVSTPAEVCESRDPKGHYAKARAGGLPSFTGLGKDYEAPQAAELVVDTTDRSIGDAAEDIERLLTRTGILFGELADIAANI
ncbi:adenylyl-sulfate kinase [Bradyrhizobium sp. U87765 SZCCT0131]|uniref:adenylyl-sulfate kinase n=1 Tax=unclassified Bradyrhizobium TaxID=2631580 RepID=UPI001BA56313|nr:MULTISPECIES: adenylyl-sulfate kinase [unclassified Bradyrhizobium]MBR1222062.1 adenylyl-sulfate kinase [Bradyrhizobium sp. U87765 SZCCT0131]MBR1263740.1 adenylyl-sulfate kinase [Bradyrhizobium sp. U87765 SZCCT0134]MBR1302690.1 adenylyl-sulfate kinase [Bradyrhizobium sp. U87765 SZCCT0110]MBR1319990.1 adenylyl-sulfate kinase [Bradyrhizobium sp. U87765 SZCCT0109]MBR1348897.1 adenylyl-sulfate kinase [Bradyrhizobium sp. U87765 SZCCT0048]